MSVLRLCDDPVARPLPAGGAVLNGAGEMTGMLTAGEWRVIESPVFLTSTMQLGRVYDAACEELIARGHVTDEVVIPVVGECDDSYLSEMRAMQVTRADVAAAWDAADGSVGASSPPEEGAVGAGTGMSCLGWKGGIGTSSRVLPSGHVVAVVLLTNFGDAHRLTVDGVAVGAHVRPPLPPPPPGGSCIGVAVTNLPLDGASCERLARRIGLGLARTGSTADHGSGEVFLAVSTGVHADRQGRLSGAVTPPAQLDVAFEAVVDAAEEAVISSMLAARTVTGVHGNTSTALTVADLTALLAGGAR